ncbi:TIGR02300 family protein [Devosia algicola]|uniref:TIGR02300 family protein n=1 Tax=Devosia algicola TaxID=3026418 RepID=A0ABY7YLK2_9HYPH|nr:TIGR02300 family protein [Devosia algicola]WDR01975.1 TIGR02300 family protein [Devosia algicola]
MASSERGTKRTDPDTGKKFYDLNLNPIVSPYTGKSYPLSYFEEVATSKISTGRAAKGTEEEVELVKDDEAKSTDSSGPEIVSLEDADAEESGDEEIPDTDDVEVDDELSDDEQDVFLEEEDDDDDDLAFKVGSDDDA